MDDSKTGVELKGVKARNPYNGELIPVFISDYVLTGYGTGAIMAVPAHDQRDYDFAKALNLPIVQVLEGGDIAEKAWEEDGAHINSGFLNGMNKEDGMKAAIRYAEEHGFGRSKVNFKLRDWVFSRQRYWGEPIPMVYCEKCGWQPIPESELPLTLPPVPDYHPNDEGESPLSKAGDWLNATCPKCGGHARRETDTMPNWAGSSWYFLRYCDPHNDKAFASKEALDYWMNVDWYNGGMEHTTLHLLYSRFWHKFLYDCGLVPTKEPYNKRTSHGMILAENGEKMSKSRGNVINPDDIVDAYGADTFRLYEMFIGPFDQVAMWSDESLMGVYSANEYLTRGNLMIAYQPGSHSPIMKSRAVAVVGGGNVAMDGCRTAIRLGAKDTYIIYRRSQAEMPADAEEVAEAMEEGVQFRFLSAPAEILGENGKVKALKVEIMELGEPDAKGRRKPVGTGKFETIEVTSVIGAIGQRVDLGHIAPEAMAFHRNGTVQADGVT